MKSLLNVTPNPVKFLLWIGLFLLAAGLTAGVLGNSWGVLPLSLLGVGFLALLGWLLGQGNALRGFWGRRSTQDSTNALVATLAAIALFLIANFLAMRYSSRVDLTENQIFTLAPQTQELVQGLEQPVKLWIFDSTPNLQDRELLERYRRLSPQFSYEYVDPDAQPGLVERFGVQQRGEVFLEQGDRRRKVQNINDQERLSEQRLTNGIAQLSSDRQLTVKFLQGHGERPLAAGQGGLSQASDNLTQENFTPAPLNLAQTPTIPEDTSVVVLAGPQRPLLKEEVDALKKFLQRRSGLMILADPQTDPGLNDLLQEWGVTLGDRILVDPDGGREGAVTIITDYGPHPITQSLGNNISFYPLARPLIIAEKPGIQANPILLTNDRTQGQRVGPDGRLIFDPAQDPQGVLTLGAAFSRPGDQGEARLVVIGNSSFITDGVFDQQYNKDVFLNAIAWLSQDENQRTLAIRPKEMTDRRITLAPMQQLWLILGSLVFLPLVGFVMAIGVWWKRR